MVQLVPLSAERHRCKRWKRPAGYAFAANEWFVPLSALELARAVCSMPVAFVDAGTGLDLAAITSVIPNRNMFVDPKGRWLGSYVPAWLRVYPFRLIPGRKEDEVIFCVDEGSGLVVDDNGAGEQFFDAEGRLSPALSPVLSLLQQLETGFRATRMAVAALAHANVIIAWKLKIKSSEGEPPIDGIRHIDQELLRNVSDEGFLELRRAGALPIAFAQTLSEAQLSTFVELAKFHKRGKPPVPQELPESLDTIFQLPAGDTIQFKG